MCSPQYVNAASPFRTLADTGGLVVTDDGRRVLVFDRCTGALTVLAFVLGVLTLVAGGFGAVALAAAVPSRALGAAFLAGGLVFAAATYAVVRKIRHRRGQRCTNAVQWPSSTASSGCSVTAAEPWCRWIRCASREGCRSVRAHRNSSR